MTSSNNNQAILIVEDDPDQMELLVSFALSEIQSLIEDGSTTDQQSQKLKDIKILKVSNISTLEKAVSVYKGILLAVLDCNIPDTKDGTSHDQLVKTNYRITGQHKSVDIVTEHLPSTPITMISSLNRFQKIVSRYYKSEHDLNINFISKNDQLMISRNIGYYLRQYLSSMSGSSYHIADGDL